jgi:hypothetical protein
MPEKFEFTPSGFEVKAWPDHRMLKIEFSKDGGHEVGIILTPIWVPLIVQELEKAAAHTRPKPVEPGDLKPQMRMQLHGHQVNERPGGGALLTVYVKIEGQKQNLSLPIDLPPRDLAHLVEALNAFR